jgi:hypothetical protein
LLLDPGTQSTHDAELVSPASVGDGSGDDGEEEDDDEEEEEDDDATSAGVAAAISMSTRE